MTTDSERREVARSLRRLAEKHDGVAWPLVEKHLGLVGDDRFLGSSVYTSASVLHVVDLIEPEPERTCKRRNHDTDNYYMRCCSCSRCNAGWFEDIYDKPFSYCPHCGAKVVDE